MSEDQVVNKRWGVTKRLELIEFKLFWDGKVNRGDLQNCFKISVPQASADLATYIEMAPGNLAYDKRAKCYYRTETFSPVLVTISSDYFLSQLQAISIGVLDPHIAGISKIPPIAHTPLPPRMVEPNALRAVTTAITSNSKLEIVYQSMSSGKPKTRWISPHALAYDEFRWHVRAFCHNDLVYKDFVIGRIMSVGKSEESETDPATDLAWHNFITLVIIANPRLNPAQRRIIELDYGMRDKKLEINTRIALAIYALKAYRLDNDTDSMPANAQHIVLNNRIEVLAALGNRLTF